MKTSLFFFLIIGLLSFAPLRSYGQGSGADGPLNVASGTTTINSVATAISGSNAVGTTINVTSTAGFAVGDLILIIQMDGTNAGTYDERTITSLTLTSFTFSGSTSAVYSSSGANRAQVIRVPQYTTVTVNSGATLTAPPWNGATGGVLIFAADGAVTDNGTITMSGKGFTGGTGGTGNAAGTAGASGSGANSSGGNGTDASPVVGGLGGVSAGGDGGNGGIGNMAAAANPGITGNGTGGGTSGYAGANMSSGLGMLTMGGGGGGGQGGRGGQYGGSGGGGGASSVVLLGSGGGSNGQNGTVGTASTAVGGTGGTGGGIILMHVNSFAGNGLVVTDGQNGTAGTGVGGTGGDGGNGGNGGAFLSGLVLTNGGGGGGGGKGGQGGMGSGGGGGGGPGVIAMTSVYPTSGWTGSMSNNPGSGGVGGAGGTSGVSGNGGTAGGAFLLGTPGVAGASGGAVSAGPTGPSGQPSPSSIPPIYLPVTLLSFTGKVSGQSILLNWNTTSAKTNHTFIIEKSTDGVHYTTLTEQDGKNSSADLVSYAFTDNNPYNGHNYYRLTEVDENGEHLLNVIEVEYQNQISTGTFEVYPNPVGEDKIIYLTSSEVAIQSIKITLYSVTGQVLFLKEGTFQMEQYKLLLPEILESGVYTLEIAGYGSQTVKTEKMVVR
ncbi:MAG TPA: T9SS type A sorting domain-containing protein [Cytophagaceae bacterium]|nr:T9SS type A sorting domain-containing protein [Cytophagaceae bacterium]